MKEPHMSTALPVSASQTKTSRRVPVLAAASALVAAASITVTFVLADTSDTSSRAPSGVPVHAHPDRATLYQRDAETPQPSGAIEGRRSAERFHHFR
jgi:hypothetical protein